MSTTHVTKPLSEESAIASIGLFLMINTFETGGSERQCALLANHANAARFQVHVGCVNPRGPLADQFGNYEQFPLGGSLFGWTALRTRWALGGYLRRKLIQVAHAFDFYTNLTLIPSARLARVPVVIGSHRQLGDLLTLAQFRAQMAMFRWCDALVCNSQAGADRLAASGVAREKLAVIGNAMPDNVFEPAAPAVSPHGSPRVTMIARMNAHYKNHAGFLRIAAEVHKRLPAAEFLLVGDGPLRAEIEQHTADLGLSQQVIFLGDRRDIAAILASSDISVLTSDSEGLSNVILESMAAGVPVVAYAVGGNPELVNDERGALIPAGNEREFAGAICRLLSDANQRRAKGRNARAFAEHNFSLAHVCRQYEDLYTRLLEGKRRR
ncbi:MAG TPA: glycosyltransferase [Terriglobales bacterium]|nr:glycosyltransferase [Terriglobales bacterium]